MNLRAMVLAIFDRHPQSDMVAVRQSGVELGRETAATYCDGFFEGAGEVFAERLQEFQSATVIFDQEPAKIASKPKSRAKS